MLNPYEGGKFRVTSTYGNRTLNGKKEYHPGLDVVGVSSKNLLAICNGTVIQSRIVVNKSDLTWQWGNYVTIQADTGERVIYAHLSQRLVYKGQRVKKGDVIGIEGNTGYSFGSHCHLEVRTSGNKVTSTVNTPSFTGVPNAVGSYEVSEVQEEEEMTREEVQAMIDASKERVYHYWKELPDWAYAPIKALYDKSYFTGASAADLNLPESLMRTLVVLARSLKADGKLDY